MVIGLVHIASLIVALLLTIRRATCLTVFSSSAVILGLGGIAQYVWFRGMFSSAQAASGGAFLVINDFHKLMSMAILWTALSAVLWFRNRLSAADWPRLTSISFWALALGLSGGQLLLSILPRPGDAGDLATTLQIWTVVAPLLTALLCAGFGIFVALLAAAILHHRRYRHE